MKALFEETVTAYGKATTSFPLGGEAAFEDEDGNLYTDRLSAADSGHPRKPYIVPYDILEKFERDGFFASPGNLIPNFF